MNLRGFLLLCQLTIKVYLIITPKEIRLSIIILSSSRAKLDLAFDRCSKMKSSPSCQVDNEDSSSLLSTQSQISSSLESDAFDALARPLAEDRVQKLDFQLLWTDSKTLEEEVEGLKWMARRKEQEWDNVLKLVGKKKDDIKDVKKEINMIRTINDLGPQLDVDSDDEDTASESSDEENHMKENNAPPPVLYAHKQKQLPVPLMAPPKVPDRVEASHNNSTFIIKPPKKHSIRKGSHSHYTTGHLCRHCRSKPIAFVCGSCKKHWYCSAECQQLAWPFHSEKCKSA